MAGLGLPLVTAFFAFLAGLLAGLRLGGSAVAAAVGAGAAVLAVPLAGSAIAERRVRARAGHGLVLLALALGGHALGAHARGEVDADCRARLADGARLEIRGLLAANHLPVPEGGRTPLLPVIVTEAKTARGAVPGCRAEARVRLPRAAGPLLAGTELRLRGEWRRMPGPAAPSGWPRSPAYAGYLSVRELDALSPPRAAAHPFLAARGRMERQLHRLFPRHGPLADALLLGRRETLDRALADRFAKSGLVHLLAISGTHVALMGTVFLLLGRAARLSRTRVAWLTIALIAAYLAVIGAPPSALRSGVMMALGLAAVVLQRPSATLPTVAAAAFVLLGLQPMAALDAGVQLSFAGVLGIVVLRRAMLDRIPLAWREHAAGRWLAESLVVSVAAFLATAPIVAHHFGQVAPISILAVSRQSKCYKVKDDTRGI